MALLRRFGGLRPGILLACLGSSLAGLASHAEAQVLSENELQEAGRSGAFVAGDEVGRFGVIPLRRGLNASLGTSSQHDSSSGWSSILTPDITYRLNRHFRADVSVPVYTYVSTYENTGTKAKPKYTYAPKKGVFGDTSLSFHADAAPFDFGYDASISVGLPSGDTFYGLGAGQVTFNINNHVEHSLWCFTPNVEVGYGDSSTLVDPRVRKDYISVGPLAHFQVGLGVPLLRDLWFEADAYEQLPLSKDLIYSTTTKGKKKVTTAKNVGVSEDNGFLTSLDIPLSPHLTLSGFYNRSLRAYSDVAGFSFTYLLRGAPRSATE
ncbi:MAG: hypothetical protein M3O02_00260 [Acidobacteriota bacterium]|nr:hypothetical protein [Acidobacteriota bacterium]